MLSISIHALREEGDLDAQFLEVFFVDFYPRPPRGGRHRFAGCFYARFGFLSTPSARRATDKGPRMIYSFDISIHALREEGDPVSLLQSAYQADFYPRPPRGGRPADLHG